MFKVCPNPITWVTVFERLTSYASSHQCLPPMPPNPLVLGGWWCTSDLEKKKRWDETVEWASNNGCSDIIDQFDDYYYVEEFGDYIIPMYREKDYEAKPKQSAEALAIILAELSLHWSEIIGPELGKVTTPLAFTGAKGRRLVVQANFAYSPQWGGWTFRSLDKSERITFTHFRKAINDAIKPHEVDHIDFIPDWRDY